jgi:hypothetical protein
VSVGQESDQIDVVADVAIELEPKMQEEASLPLNLENLQALKSQYKSSTEVTEQQQLLLKIERLIGFEKSRKMSENSSIIVIKKNSDEKE